jgi:hypothetical protein
MRGQKMFTEVRDTSAVSLTLHTCIRNIVFAHCLSDSPTEGFMAAKKKAAKKKTAARKTKKKTASRKKK